MTARRIEPVGSRDGEIRALRLHLHEDAGDELFRTEPAGPGLRIDFDVHGRPLALEIEADGPPDPDRIDRVLEALGQPVLDGKERAAVLSDG